MTIMPVAQVLQLALIASYLSGYSMPALDQLPEIQLMTSRGFHEQECNGNMDPKPSDPCMEVVGRYTDNGTIWVDAEAINGTENKRHHSMNSFIVHELTHWLQFEHAWGGMSPCSHLAAREAEAYRVQNLYIAKYDEPGALPIDGAPVECPNRSWAITRP
ncbi:MAG: hypothetical protein ACREQ5_09790 [Candidatus Dormibacteria bacterium]